MKAARSRLSDQGREKKDETQIIFDELVLMASTPALPQNQTEPGCHLRGTAVWKYNEYVGLKPDVGR
jgi:hypothetical protein